MASSQDVADGHASDQHALQIRFEDLVSDDRGNATLRRIFSFLLLGTADDGKKRAGAARDDGGDGEQRVDALVSIASRALPAFARAEMLGESQRKRVAKLLLRKPAKCHHVNKVHQALGYAEVGCTDDGKGGSAASDAVEERRRLLRWARRRRARRRLRRLL